jgi:hypothetical protein
MSIVGAWRWDAWYSQSSSNSRGAQNCLGPAQFQSRAPWFSNVVSKYKIEATGTQANMDLEIRLAKQAGLSYFAFDWYGSQPYLLGSYDAGLYQGLNLYLSSAYNGLVNYCLNLSTGGLGAPGAWATNNWQADCNVILGHLNNPCYQQVAGGRPLLFVTWYASDITNYFAGSVANLATAIAYLRAGCTRGNPYIVIIDAPSSADSEMASVSADAIGLYGSGQVAAALPDTYANLTTKTQNYWTNYMLPTGAPLILPMSSGQDNRPQCLFGVPWQASVPPLYPQLQYWQAGTPAAVASHITSALSFLSAHSAVCPAASVAIYSWNECSEGGNTLCPTLGDPPVNTDAAYATWLSANPSWPAALPTSNMLAAIGGVLRGN